MEEKDYIKELFSEKLGNLEAPVNPELWNSIASKIPTNILSSDVSSIVSSSISSATKLIIGISISAAIALLVLVALPEKNKKTYQNVKNNSTPVVEKEQKNSEQKVLAESKEEIVNSNYKNNSSKGKENKSELIKSVEQSFKSNLENVQNSELLPEPNYPILVTKTEIKRSEIKKESPFTSIPVETVIKTPLPIEKPEYFIGELPNIFTPNNDGNNDVFKLEIKGISDFSITILNKDNKRIFSSDDINFSWNGRDFSDKLVELGSYVYYFSGKDSKGNVISKSSTLKVQY